ncbi:MAG: very short patch repair endonuclease [Achromobacter xylosoxidans]
MAAVRGRETKPERAVRSALHALGLRFRLYLASLPGSPDIVLRRYYTVVLVHGCFWHGHGCPRGKAPSSRLDSGFPSLPVIVSGMRDRLRSCRLLDGAFWSYGNAKRRTKRNSHNGWRGCSSA